MPSTVSMPKRYADRMDPTLNSDSPPQKTQRSHEQNKERAYIAASRRTDRSIEARLQSAHMASEIHERRTGKGLCVSEAIVMREEMYEEVEEGFPRSYYLLGPHQQSSSAEMNLRKDSHLKSWMAMSEVVSARDQHWRENEVNREFAKHFPQTNHSLSRRWSTASYPIAPPAQSDQSENLQRHSFGLDANVNTLTPPALTAGSSSNPDTPQSEPAPIFGSAMPTNSFRDFNPDESIFSADLSSEAKMLVICGGQCQSDTIDPALFDQHWMMYADEPSNISLEVSKPAKVDHQKDSPCELSLDSLDSISWIPVSEQNISADESSWNTSINDIVRENDQQ